MAEPHSATGAGILTGAGIGLTGTVLGAQLDALVIGMMSATFMAIWLPSINDKLKSASAVAMGSMLAGYSYPVANWVAKSFDGIDYSETLRLLMAALIGIAIPALLPTMLARARVFIGGNAP